jgi:hypothetical protein
VTEAFAEGLVLPLLLPSLVLLLLPSPLQACTLAAARLDAHWRPGGEVQEGLRGAAAGARQAADAAQLTRRQAQLLSGRLDAAAMIIESGSKSAQMKLVAHQLDEIS